MDGEQGERPQASRMGAAALLLAGSVLLSRLFGYGREALLAYQVGAGAATDAYYAAFQIPDLLNYLLAGGALSIAFLPLYTRKLADGDQPGADHLLATVLGTLTAAALLATMLAWIFAAPLIALQFPRFDAVTQATAVHLTRIVLPAQVFFIAGGIINATLFAHGRFGAAAVAPLLYNGGIIAGGLLLAPRPGVEAEGFAWGALAGAVAGPFLAPLLMARGRVRLGVRIAPTDRTFLAYLLIAAPLMFGQTLLTVDEWYERWFGALLGAGAVSHLSYARRLMQVPVAVVGQAIAAAALPTLSRLFAEGRRDELNGVVLRTLQAGLALAVVAAAGCFALATPLVQVVYQRGRFTADDTVAVAGILALLCFAVPAWITQQIAARAFYARADTWRPMLLGTLVAFAAVPLYLALGNALGVRGLALAPAIGMSVNALATLIWARWLHGAPALGALAATTGRAALVGAGAAALVRWGLPAQFASASGALLGLGVGATVYAALVAIGAWTVGDRVLREVLARMLRRVWR
ncbi:MAG: murein biosynthesis integral membrane protein MurJ [Deltaproteobacteria bacterium]|nr:murein biosynthesis integral membrane protein MurJ [Deltaproteobacteria bacterium]